MEQIIVILLLGATIGVARWIYKEYVGNRNSNTKESKKNTLSIIKNSIEDYSKFRKFSENIEVKIDDSDSTSLNEFIILRLSIINIFLFARLGNHEGDLVMDKLVPETFTSYFDFIKAAGYDGSENTFFSECQSVYNKRQSLYSKYSEKGLLSPGTITDLSSAFSDLLYHYHPKLGKNNLYTYSKIYIPGIISSTFKISKDL